VSSPGKSKSGWLKKWQVGFGGLGVGMGERKSSESEGKWRNRYKRDMRRSTASEHGVSQFEMIRSYLQIMRHEVAMGFLC
jgi:hypothetical protein